MGNKLKGDIDTKARILGYGIGKNSSGDPQVVISMSVNFNPAAKDESEADWNTLTWYGNLGNETGREITGKALLVCGFKEDSQLHELGGGIESEILDKDRPINVNVGPSTYQSKTHDKVKWINAPGTGGSKAIEKMDSSEAKKMLSGINSKQMMSTIRNENAHLAKLAEEGDADEELF